jgi:hypothetical protein
LRRKCRLESILYDPNIVNYRHRNVSQEQVVKWAIANMEWSRPTNPPYNIDPSYDWAQQVKDKRNKIPSIGSGLETEIDPLKE